MSAHKNHRGRGLPGWGQRRASVGATGPCVEALEGRALLTGDVPTIEPPNEGGLLQAQSRGGGGIHQTAGPNLAVTSLRLSDLRGNVIGSVVTGQMIVLRCDWTSDGLGASSQYVVRFMVDGAVLDSRSVSGASGNGSYYWYLGGWYAAPGSHNVQATVDGANTVVESSESDNTITTTVSPVAPTSLPYQLTQPIGGRANVDWGINNYADVDPRANLTEDYLGGEYQYDGHDGIDAGPMGFSHMDDGVPVIAAAPGVVTDVHDGEFDRQTALGNNLANYVILDHGGGWQTIYWHLSTNTVAVKLGDSIARGQVLGLMGSSGYSTGVHLHFSLLKNGMNVETGYAPSAYWVQPLPYGGDVAFTVLDSGISNYRTSADADERISDVSTFPTSSGWTVFYWLNVMNVKPGDQYRFNWYRPDGVLAGSFSLTLDRFRFAKIYYSIAPSLYSAFPGTWQAALVVNGVERDRRSFQVTAGGGAAEIKVTETSTGKILLDGRTTAFSLGTAAVGAPAPQKTFTILNPGSQPLTTAGLVLPPAFSLAGAFPSSIAANASANFTVQMDTARAGTKFGEVRFNTNDADEGIFTFNVSGAIGGSAPAGAAALLFPGPAVVYAAGQAPKVLDPTCDTSSGANYANAVLQAEFAGHGSADDRLTVLSGPTVDGNVGVTGNAVTMNGAPVATLTGGLGDGLPLVVSFNSAGTQAAVRAVARSIAYSNISPAPSTVRRYVRFTVTTTGVVSNQPVKTVEYDTAPRPQIVSMALAGAAAQRSQVASLAVTFDRPVSLAAGVARLVLLNSGGSGLDNGAAPTDASSALAGVTPTTTDGGLTWVFAAAVGTPFVQPNGSLIDGIYTMTLDPAKISYYGVSLAYAATAGTGLTFHRLFGDINGSKNVNNADFAPFRNAFLKSAGDPTFNPAFDFDSNGIVNNADFAQFRNRFGKAFSY